MYFLIIGMRVAESLLSTSTKKHFSVTLSIPPKTQCPSVYLQCVTYNVLHTYMHTHIHTHNTHTSIHTHTQHTHTYKPLLYFLFPNFDSSISTSMPGPPILQGLSTKYCAQTSLMKLYQSTAVCTEIFELIEW